MWQVVHVAVVSLGEPCACSWDSRQGPQHEECNKRNSVFRIVLVYLFLQRSRFQHAALSYNLARTRLSFLGKSLSFWGWNRSYAQKGTNSFDNFT